MPSTTPANDEPLGPKEADRLFAPFFPEDSEPPAAALAVSGGADSTALMVLFAEWLQRGRHDPSRHTVLTVDHGLRAQSRAEANAVAAHARAFRYRHATLSWHEGRECNTGIQVAARRARYRLMGAYMHAHGIGMLLTAHTRDDQAETVLMRLARGSGVDGLSAIAPSIDLADLDRDAVREPRMMYVVRPLLDVPKARLLATLCVRDIPHFEDPSNQAPAHERSRLRAARAALDALGLSHDMLALSARRLLRARRALEQAAERFCGPEAGAVGVDPCGVFTVDLARLGAAEAEVALRALGRLVAAAGGSSEPVPMGKLEVIAEALSGPVEAASWTLARALISAKDGAVTIEREPGREPLPKLTLAPGEEARWDGRFVVAVACAAAAFGGVEVRALGEAALAQLRRQDAVAKPAFRRAAALVPSFWRGPTLLAAPALGYWESPAARRALAARFIGLQACDPDTNSQALGAP